MSSSTRAMKRKLDDNGLKTATDDDATKMTGIHASSDTGKPAKSVGLKEVTNSNLGNDDLHHGLGLLAPPRPPTVNSPLLEPKSRSFTSITSVAPVKVARVFLRDASVILIGMRGSGKSTLAVILSTATGRRLVEAEQYFQNVTGCSRHAYKKKYDADEYRRNETRIMSLMLSEHKEGCVIVCGPGSMGKGVQKLLKDYALTNPVIHIVRDPLSIQKYLQGWSIEKVNHFLTLSGPLYRACSNMEFFNVSELKSEGDNLRTGEGRASANSELSQRPSTTTPFLALKRVQRDFLRFVAFITGDTGALRRINAALPLSSLSIESRPYTYVLTVPLSALLQHNLDIEDIVSTADAVELRIDVLDLPSVEIISESALDDKIGHVVATIRRNILVPMIYHVLWEPSKSIGLDTSSTYHLRDLYFSLVMLGLRLAPEFLTIDLAHGDSTLAQFAASKGPTRIMGHLESNCSSWEAEECMAAYRRAIKLGCDIVRLSRAASSIEDNFAVQRFRHQINTLSQPHPPIIAFNSGILGRLSCWANPILTPVSHQCLQSSQNQRQNPQLTVRDAQLALFASFTLDPLKFYVFGGNVMNSLSPAMHTAAYRAFGMPHEYKPYQSSSLRSLASLMQDPHFGGSSINLPFKIEVITLLQSLSPHARAIGAVNTVLPIRSISENGTIPTSLESHQERNRAGPVRALHGDNTDWIGIFQCIRRGLSPANAVSPSSTGLVIGAGGMARAAIYSMIHLGVRNIFIHNRTLENAEKLAQHYYKQFSKGKDTDIGKQEANVHVISSLEETWPTQYKYPTMVVSCIPAHSTGEEPTSGFEVPASWLSSPTGGVVVEVS
jgi:shikimate 5-dehydrogenase/shikimate kinase/3-dehydroquinate dehydratase